MRVTQTYTYLGDLVHEQVTTVDGEEITFVTNVLPATGTPVLPPANTGSASSEEFTDVPVAQPLGDPVVTTLECAAAPAPTKKKRTLWGFIRATWFIAFTALGEALTYLLNNLTSLNLPAGTATAIGAVGYGLKRGLWPDTTI